MGAFGINLPKVAIDPKFIAGVIRSKINVKRQIMELLRKLQREQGMSILLITHDIGLVAQMTNRVMVMYAGQVVECAPTAELFAHPAHPYTRALLRAVPHADGENEQLHGIPGSVPERYGEMVGCRFASRCPTMYLSSSSTI